ncbi:hypothetical protein K431DRAFT_317601 [Polychaeton citri CBS 116435]|uniref:Uncharacterized protein n=1 Tax=Polychaeton citri CBS 116435 TaxID=1314669 RepID=A0A9P4QIS5_9PEZI|nr:hypothetical protein K431DRAFT_317601 [Polychaeton citri CBS 116435]
MRDRRNTSLSVSSTTSTTSTASGGSSRDSFHEKRLSSDLPPPATREYRSKPRWRRSAVAKVLLVTGCLLLALRVFGLHLWYASLAWPSVQVDDTNFVGGDALPEEPTALMMSDKEGRSRWTVSIPPNSSFPLRGRQYSDICRQSESIRSTITHRSHLAGQGRKGQYKSKDRTFMEPQLAEDIDVLPKPLVGAPEDVCERSLVFALESNHVSLGKTLMMLWLSFALAKEQGRAFFIDDTRWAYGSYTSFFKQPPAPGCSRPPTSHIVPCPHTADHLIVSAATAEWTFGPLFHKEYVQPRRGPLGKSERMFGMIRDGYDALFHLNEQDDAYVEQRSTSLREEATKHAGPIIGMHIRRGDLHPNEFAYQFSYLPIERYTNAAKKLMRDSRRASQSQAGSDAATADTDDLAAILDYTQSPLLLASDDPNVLRSDELAQNAAPFTITPAQDRLQLATKEALDRIAPSEPQREPGSAYVKHVDENTGWEGGFFSALFKSLGHRSSDPDSDEIPGHTLRMRELVAKGYLLDLAILGRSDGVVCAVSSAGCRILGVMMGWDAVAAGRWVNVDDRRSWTWDGSR